jgi:hypothetical protein
MHNEDGSVAIQTVGVILIMMLMFMLMIFAHRLPATAGEIASAARDGVRAAALSQTRTEAESRGRAVIDEQLAEAANFCDTDTLVLGWGYEAPNDVDATLYGGDDIVPGTIISLDVVCTVEAINFPLIPSDSTVSISVREMADRYRGNNR